MQARPYVLGGAALLATSMVAATPLVAPRQLQLPVRSIETRLVDAGSVLNIPFNLFQDIVNIPNNELEAFNQFGVSLIDGGTWWAASATNLWGEDPGDPGRFMAMVDMLVPFTALSGQGSPEPGFGDFSWADAAAGHLGLSQQISLLLDAEIPVSASSDATWSDPLLPVAPITGLTGIDRTIWAAEIFTNQTQYPLIDDWFKVPMSDLTSGHYNFGTVADPSAGVGPNGAVPTDNVFGFAGTHPEMGNIGYGVNDLGQTLNANGNPVNLMPWSNETFTFNPMYPFENFYNSLTAPVDPSTYLSGFQFPSFQDLLHALQTYAAGSVIAFDSDVPGNALACVPTCNLPDSLQLTSLVQDINNLDPGNTAVQHWIDLLNTPSAGPGGLLNPFGSANGPTQEQVNFADLFGSGQQQMFDLGNPYPTDPQPPGVETPINFGISPAMQNLIDFMKESGIQGLVQQWADAQGYTPIDFSNPDLLLTPASAVGASTVPLGAFDPSQLSAGLSALLGSQLSTDLTQLLATGASADLTQLLTSELSAELPQLLGSQLSTDLLSMF